MKLNPDCLRDILLYLEENLQITPELEIKSLVLGQIASGVAFPIEEIANTLLALHEAGFIVATHNMAGGNIIYRLSVSRITYSGYQFIETIRPKTVWDHVKAILNPVGSHSVELITNVAGSVLSAMIEGRLNP